ncbi:MAG: ribonuclease domain-containing protein [Butyricicoccaceae bacterium]
MRKKLLSVLMLLVVLAAPLLSGCSQEQVDTAFSIASAVLEESGDDAQAAEQEDQPGDTAEAKPDHGEQPLDPNGSYTDEEEVALYLYTYGELPQNFITKNEAKKLGWDSSKGNLQEVAPGMSIGGDRFGNYEGRLPEGTWTECDVNYHGGYRGSERLVFSSDGTEIYYTNDHYETFEQLY